MTLKRLAEIDKEIGKLKEEKDKILSSLNLCRMCQKVQAVHHQGSYHACNPCNTKMAKGYNWKN